VTSACQPNAKAADELRMKYKYYADMPDDDRTASWMADDQTNVIQRSAPQNTQPETTARTVHPQWLIRARLDKGLTVSN
jgi:hypothetical protein